MPPGPHFLHSAIRFSADRASARRLDGFDAECLASTDELAQAPVVLRAASSALLVAEKPGGRRRGRLPGPLEVWAVASRRILLAGAVGLPADGLPLHDRAGQYEA
ncbi:MAG: hypothetical protein WAV54_15840 [Acidimicrobiales bacterium]